jgi:hypothetical protein
MNLDTHLQSHGVTLEGVYQRLADAVGVRPEEVVYLSGSLLAGLGNLHSDIDAFIVTSRPLPPSTVGDVFMLPFEDTQIDLERWTPAAIESLFQRLEEATRHVGARDPRPAMLFTARELEFLYRLSIGRPLTDEWRFAALVARLDPERVARVLFDRAWVVGEAVHTDIAGFLHVGDEVSAFLAARHLVDLVADAFLASQGEINPGPKWRYRMLHRLGPRPDGLELPPHLAGARMVDTFVRFWTGGNLEDGLAHYARQAVMLSNFVLPWCQRRLDRYDVMDDDGNGARHRRAPLETSLSAGSDTSPDGALGRLKIEARVRWDGKETRLHLPGHGYAIGVGRVAHVALAYFDGRTTVSQAAQRLAAFYGSPGDALVQALLDLRAVLLGCGFVDRP